MDLALKTAALGGIFMLWYTFTEATLKFSWHIMTTSPENDTYEPVTSVECTECGNLFTYDEQFVCPDCIEPCFECAECGNFFPDETFVCFECSGGPTLN